VARGGPLNMRQTCVRIDPRLQLPKQLGDFEDVGRPFMISVSEISEGIIVYVSRRLLCKTVEIRCLYGNSAPCVSSS